MGYWRFGRGGKIVIAASCGSAAQLAEKKFQPVIGHRNFLWTKSGGSAAAVEFGRRELRAGVAGVACLIVR
jgi:hypothetical protein